MNNRMKQNITKLICAAFIGSALVPSALAEDDKVESVSLELSVSGIKKQSGQLRISLFANEQSFSGGAPVQSLNLSADAAKVTGLFAELEPGIYAIKMFHDVNADGKLNMNVFGIPMEPYGFSNNAPARFGPASWEDAQFTVTAEQNQTSIDLSSF